MITATYYYFGHRQKKHNLPFRRGNLMLTEIVKFADCSMEEAGLVEKTLDKFFISDDNAISLHHVPPKAHRRKVTASSASCLRLRMSYM